MWLIDQLAEQHIHAAQEKGELSNLPGEGKPLQLDDDSYIPSELRTGYRLLKNSGFLPPELELRREAIEINDLLKQLDPKDPSFPEQRNRLVLLECRLRQTGMSTDFLHSDYGAALHQRFEKK
ncbi:MAG: DUF1992 domain-containing protein [Enterobacterales bacterium endosymbiont of Blomia tropicalis]|uniref:DnaJ family domain-containing protein n=1 Tax=Mixta mediterraneensis TaxID=2758443 RepID=UPI0025A8FC36|nr:DUF1992 domain-containing protein [Mixta mediterraneensis]MDL4915829.1 DUF1992 domain-containing protein [Mixta mediterraneensis]